MPHGHAPASQGSIRRLLLMEQVRWILSRRHPGKLGNRPQSAPASAGLTAIPVDEDKNEAMLKEAVRQHEQEIKLLALWKEMPYRDSWSDLVSSRFWLEGSVSTYQVAIERTGVGILQLRRMV